jgi:hypothetical protein
MKIALVVLSIVFAVKSFAGCADDFSNGVNEYAIGSKYFDKGLTAYNKAVEMARSSNPDFLAICNKLVDSVSGFSVATDSYGGCANHFNLAISSCTLGDSVQARKYKAVCVDNQGVASGNQAALRSTLQQTCYKASKSFEEIELEEIDYLEI